MNYKVTMNKRIMAWILSFILIICAIPSYVWAAKGTSESSDTLEEAQISTDTPENKAVVSVISIGEGECFLDNQEISELEITDGETVLLTFTPKAGNVLSKVKLNEKELSVEEYASMLTEDGLTFQYIVEHVTADITVSAEFVHMGVVSAESLGIMFSGAVRVSEDQTLYVYDKNTKQEDIQLKANNGGKIKVNEQGNLEMDSWIMSSDDSFPYTIHSVCVYFLADGERIPQWYQVELPTKGWMVDVDTIPPTVEIMPAEGEQDFYDQEVTMKVSAKETGNYAGIVKVEYEIFSDNNTISIQSGIIELNQLDIWENQDEIIVQDCDDYESVTVSVRVTDAAGNTAIDSYDLNIHSVRPRIFIEMDGSQSADAKEGFYNCVVRTATITIKERDSTFDENAANEAILSQLSAMNFDGEILTTPVISAWRYGEDVDGKEDKNVHIATIVFKEEGIYEWDISKISYTNQAGFNNDDVSVAADSRNVTSFTIDRTAEKITIEALGHSWESILDQLTFEIFEQTGITVYAAVEDAENVEIYYYKSTDMSFDAEVAALQRNLEEKELLEKLEALNFVSEVPTVGMDGDEYAIVYAKAVDYAGNISYASTNALIVDTTGCVIDIDLPSTDRNGFYNRNITSAIKVNEIGEIYSGIANVTYEVIAGGSFELEGDILVLKGGVRTQSGYLFSPENQSIKVGTYDSLKHSIETEVTVDSSIYENNCDNVIIKIAVEDHAGNEVVQYSDVMAINCIQPKLIVSFDDDVSPMSEKYEGYFGQERTAVITVIDRTTAFDGENLRKEILNHITAKDSSDSYLTDEEGTILRGLDLVDITNWVTSEAQSDSNQAVHTMKITFKRDGNYDWDVAYTNLAGVKSEEIVVYGNTPWHFTVDTTAPEVVIQAEQFDNIWEKMISALGLHFSLWENDNISVKAKAWDATSELEVTLYGKIDVLNDILTAEEMECTTNQTLTEEVQKKLDQMIVDEVDGYTITSDEHCIIYARVEDYAGNVTYVSTNGLVEDKTVSKIQTEIMTIPDKKLGETSLYSQSVDIQTIVDEDVNDSGVYSGIQSVVYEVWSEFTNGKPICTQTFEETQNFTFDTDEERSSTYKELMREDVKGQTVRELIDSIQEVIQIKTSNNRNDILYKNNSDNVWLVVKAVDNAGNETAIESEHIAINSIQPQITISFDDGSSPMYQEIDGVGYFSESRVAAITVIDRASTFDGENLKINILKGIEAWNADGDSLIPDQEDGLGILQLVDITDWTTVENSKDPNRTTHTMTVLFKTDANYKWGFDYTNQAMVYVNTDEIQIEGETPYRFTVDHTAPETHTITVGQSTWDQLIEKLTFGLYTNRTVSVKAYADDETSPLTVEYYKTDETSVLTKKALAQLDSWSVFAPFTVGADEQFTVYLKIMDYAGNVSYISSNGYIVENKSSKITLTPEAANRNHVYKKDVRVDVKVEETSIAYSGIKTVDYTVTSNGIVTQSGNLFTFTKDNPKQAQLVQEVDSMQGSICAIVVDSKRNNSSDVVVTVTTTDNAGNRADKSMKLDIDVTSPKIDIRYDNNQDNNGNSYFNKSRVATITITERINHFDAQEAVNGIHITAVDAKGQPVTIDVNSMLSGWSTLKNDNPDMSTHTATISYINDANYTFEMSYSDAAGNRTIAKLDVTDRNVTVGDSQAPYQFTVDKTKPTGSIKIQAPDHTEIVYDKLLDALTFDYYSNQFIIVSDQYDDVTSPVSKVEYYKTSSTRIMKQSELNQMIQWNISAGKMIFQANDRFTIYFKITDMAGNFDYVSTDGIIIDDTSPIEESIAPEITILQPINGIYKNDVDVSVSVYDPESEGIYSGLKSITYQVINQGTVTQEGTIDLSVNHPTYAQLQQRHEFVVHVDSQLNNSNEVAVKVIAVDNANNQSEKICDAFSIDITAPTIEISYNYNKPDSGRYYREERIATVVITERNFNPDDVHITVCNTEGVQPILSDWYQSGGGGNDDGITHTATLTYSADGDYTFSIAYTDKAGNECISETYADGTVNEKSFTIDRTKPVVDISYANEGDYIGEELKTQTVIITIIEHNFNLDRVKIFRTAALDGQERTIPEVTWSGNGDVHIAAIQYNEDGDYTVKVEMEDNAGNKSDEMEEQKFTIDGSIEEPVIAGVEDGKAYKAEVMPRLFFRDINFASCTVKLTRTRLAEIAQDVTKEFFQDSVMETEIAGVYSIVKSGTTDIHGVEASFNINERDIEGNSNDGIYTLYIEGTDLAGNHRDKTITFSVNRFGSVYAYNPYLINLVQNGGNYVQKVTEDLVITEYSAAPLAENDENHQNNFMLEITRDGKPVDYVQYKAVMMDYHNVKVGESGWYEYTYIIQKENFISDGIYKISVFSTDAGAQTSENTKEHLLNTLEYVQVSDEYDLLDSIIFYVDATKPEITSIVGLDKSIVNEDKINNQVYTVSYMVYDTLGLNLIEIYVDNQLIDAKSVVDFQKDSSNYSGSFDLSERDEYQTVRIEVTDKAGNRITTADEDFVSAYLFVSEVLVSSKNIVRLTKSIEKVLNHWYSNKILFSCSVGLGLAVILILILMIRRRRLK
ncbi:MAG: Ig-like domain repeat protein [Lachnospiraceae bacterium]